MSWDFSSKFGWNIRFRLKCLFTRPPYTGANRYLWLASTIQLPGWRMGDLKAFLFSRGLGANMLYYLIFCFCLCGRLYNTVAHFCSNIFALLWSVQTANYIMIWTTMQIFKLGITMFSKLRFFKKYVSNPNTLHTGIPCWKIENSLTNCLVLFLHIHRNFTLHWSRQDWQVTLLQNKFLGLKLDRSK